MMESCAKNADSDSYMLLEMDDIIDLIVLGSVNKRRPPAGGGERLSI